MMVSVDSMLYSRVTLRASLSPCLCGIVWAGLNGCGNSPLGLEILENGEWEKGAGH